MIVLSGSNLVCTTIWRALHRLHARHCNPGTKLEIAHLHLQLDNCVGENKNNVVMAFLASLVDIGVVGKADANFMLVGHTHGEIDQVFSRCEAFQIFDSQTKKYTRRVSTPKAM